MKTYVINIAKQGEKTCLSPEVLVDSEKASMLDAFNPSIYNKKTKTTIVSITIQNSSQQNVYIGDIDVTAETGYILRSNEHITIVDNPSKVYLLGSGPCKVKIMETEK